MTAGWVALLLAQTAAFVVLLARLMPGRRRAAPVPPGERASDTPVVSVIVATLNEAARIAPCLEGAACTGPSRCERCWW